MPRPNETTHHQSLALGSDLELRRRFMVLDDQLQGNLRFGLLLEVLDKIAKETALNYVQRFHPAARVVTAAIDDILIRHAADVTCNITFHAHINHVGRSSLVVGSDHTTKALSNSCFFTFVNVDDRLVHQPVPEVFPATLCRRCPLPGSAPEFAVTG